MALDEQIDDPALQPLTAFNTSGGGSAPVTQRVSAPPPAPSSTPSPTTQGEEDDPALRPLGAFNYSGSTPYTPAPTWHGSDIGHGLAAGFHTGIGAPLAEITGQTDEAKAEREAGAASEAAMTPGAEQTTPVWLAEQAAPAALIMGSAAIPGVGMAVGAGVGTALQGGSAISGNKASIESANDSDLMESNPEYAADRHSGLTENQAKAKLGSSQALSVGLPSAALGAVAGLAGGAELTGFLKMGVGEAETAALTGKGLMAPAQKVIGNRATNVITGAGRELAIQGGVGAAQEGISKHADAQAGVGAEATPEEMLTSGVGQGLFGAGMFGALGGWRGPKLGEHTRDLTQKPGETTVAREPDNTEYRTDAAQRTVPADINTPPADKVAVAPTVENKGVDPAVASALGATPRDMPKGLFEGGKTIDLKKGVPTTEGITQGVTKPPAETVIPPKVVQPKEPPPTINREAPPAGDTTSPPPIPPKVADASPAPVSAPPVEEPGALTPEPRASLAEQHAQMLDPNNDRAAVIYDKGVQPFDIPKETHGQVKLPDGRIVQFDKSTPDGFTPAKVRQYAKDDRLNEALRLGPVTKTEALQRIQAGEPGTITTERTPDGTEVKGAVGTEATAPVQEAHLEASKTPGNTVQTEDPAANRAAQLDKVAQEQVVQPQVVEPNPVGKTTQTPFGPGRVLEATDRSEEHARNLQAEADAKQAQTVAQQLKAKEAARQKAAAEDAGATEAEAKRLHSSKADQEQTAKWNAAAEKIVATHAHTGSYADTDALTARVKSMARAAAKEGIEVPKVIGEGHPWNAAMVKLREAKDMLAPIKKELGETRENKMARFIDREHMIDNGRVDDALEARRAEAARGYGSPEGAGEGRVFTKKRGAIADADEAAEQTGEHIAPSEAAEGDEIATAETRHEEGATVTTNEYMHGGEEGEGTSSGLSDTEKARIADERQKLADAKERARQQAEETPRTYIRDGKKIARGVEVATERRETPAKPPEKPTERPTIEVKEGEHYSAGKAAVGFKAEVRKSRAIKRSVEGDEGEPVTVRVKGKDITVAPNRTSTAEEAIQEHYNPKDYDPEIHQMNEHLIEGLNKYAGDTPVHYLSREDMENTFGKGTRGVYDDNSGRIFIDEAHPPGTVIHEVLHAATASALEKSPELQNLMRRLRNEVIMGKPKLSLADHAKLSYAFSDPEEFLVGMMTNPNVQRLLKSVKISDQLARDIGIPKWRKMTGWNGVLHIIQKALGLGPRDVSAIEAAMSISQQAMWQHPLATGDLMEAMGRGARADEGAKPSVSLPKLRFRKEDPHESLTEGEAPARWASEADKATSKLKEIVRSLPVAGRVATAGLRHLIETPRDWVQRAKDNKWGIHDAANRWANEMGAQSATRERILKISTPVMDRLMAFQHNSKTAAEFKELGKLFISSTIHGADARDDLGVGKNEHIDPAPEDRKGNAAPENAPKEHWEAIKGNPDDRKAYKALSPEGRKLYNDTIDELSAMHDRETAAGRQALVDGVQNSLTRGVSALSDERKAAIQKVLDGNELTKEERAEHGDDDSIKAIHDYDVMTAKSKRGAYFPLDHGDGSHVVEGEHDYKLPEGATRFSENPNSPDYHRILFDNKKDALAFDPKGAAGNRLAVDHYTVEGEHHAVVNPREVQFVDGQGEGERVRAHMLAPADQGGMDMDPKKVSQVQPRKNQEVWRQSQNANLVREQIKRLDKMTDLTDSDRERMADAIKHVAASSMPGSRLRSTMLERDRTGGAGKDILRDLDKYRRRSAAAEASAKHRPAIDKAMQDMHEWADDNKGHADAGAIRQMVNMFDKRTSGSNTDEVGDPGTNRRWAAVQAYNALEGLVTPAFHLLHQLHVPLTVAPDLAAESSVGDASRILTSMYGRMGGRSMGQAFKGMGNALRKGWQYDFKPTNFIDALTHEMKMTPSERETLQWQLDHDTIQHTGMDFSHANASSSGLAQATARMRNFSGEFLGSADATNKVVSMLAYHQLGLEKGLSGEKLHQYVADGIIRTQGQFAGWNKSGAFQSPMARALLQYKQYPIKLMNMHAKAMYNSFAPTQHPTTGKWGYHAADWETRARALKVFGYMTLAAGAMSGVRGAVAWPIRLADDLAEKLGLTDGYQAHMDEIQRGIAGQFGASTADTLMNGLGAPFGLNIGHRGSISDPLGLSYALETMGKDPSASIFKWMAGAPGSTVHNVFSAADEARQGDISGMATHLLPRLIGDPIKGWQQANSGVVSGKKTLTPPVSVPQSVLKGIGFQNITETNAHEVQDLQKQETTDKAAAVQSGNYSGWNHAHPHNPIKVQDMLRAKAAAAATKQGKPKPKTAKELELEKEYSVYQ